MATGQRKKGGVQRVEGKLRACIERGDYYEAHQMYRTLYFRYSAQKKYNDALELTYSGASLLLEHNQLCSGADLAMLWLEVLTQASIPVSKENIDRAISLFKELEADSPERISYLNAALKWTKTVHPDETSGHPQLHNQLALVFWKEKNYIQSRYHFLHCSDGQGCATMLIELSLQQGFPSEVDLFIAQTVFQYLCLNNKSAAKVTYMTYTESHPQIGDGPPFQKPLLNFVWYLLLAVEDCLTGASSGKVTVFSVLCDVYQPSIRRDPSYLQYLDRIGQLFFGLPPPQQSGGSGLLDNLIQSFLRGEEEDAPPPAQPEEEDVD
ncbi:Golgi to ER traffic protein 4 homolog [Branchiostoma lanceolatum]|uniref:Golgi to ER traffic protein 4 homolog n=1 Tax=Branchiostoma lanceolatum TaxID=7740 RepID=UPI003452E43B